MPKKTIRKPISRSRSVKRDVDREIDMAHTMGRIEEKVDSVDEKVEGVCDRITKLESSTTAMYRSHEELDTNRFSAIDKKIDDKVGSIGLKLDDLINQQSSIKGGWKMLSGIVGGALGFLGGILSSVVAAYIHLGAK
jgi:hypothetical protein